MSFHFLLTCFVFAAQRRWTTFECSYSAWTEEGSVTTIISSTGWDRSDKAECCMPGRFFIPTAVITEEFLKFTVSYAFIIPVIPSSGAITPLLWRKKKTHW